MKIDYGTCADCGKPMRFREGSLPQGQARCHPCRRLRPTVRAKRKSVSRKDLPCARCGKLMWRSRTSLPAGQAVCLPCRRERQEAKLDALPPGCKDCGAPKASKRHRYCEPCRARHRKEHGHGSDRLRPSPEERGYGSAHQKARREYLEQFTPGDLCARCEQPMYDPALLDLDHTDDRAGYLGLSHRSCNRSAQPGKRRQPHHPMICDECGLEYVTKWMDQRFCSNPCRRKAQADRAAERLASGTGKPHKRKQVREYKPCELCWSVLVLTPSKYCSDECRVEKNRRIQRDRYRTRVGLPVNPDEPSTVWYWRSVSSVAS